MRQTYSTSLTYAASLLFVMLLGCNGPRQASSITGAPTAEAAVAEVTLQEDQWMDALMRKDTAVLASLLDPPFTLSASSPAAETRQQYLQTSAMPERTLQPILLQDRQFKAYGQTVVSSGKTAYTGQWKDKRFHLPVRYTTIFVKQQNGWKAVTMHFSIIQ
jgi:ketosteroid isomerase-like protein